MFFGRNEAFSKSNIIKMTSLPRFIPIAVPVAIGIGVVLLSSRLISNEQRILERKMELELQIGAKALRGD